MDRMWCGKMAICCACRPMPSSCCRRLPCACSFGDVPADFIRVDDPVAKPLDLKVPDLFGYAVHEAPQEPDAADMSVDDILDLRAGEPTAIFSADNVRRKVDELELGSLNITQPVTKNDEPAIPRDLFADALAQHAEQETERKNQQAMNSVALPKQQTEPESTIVRLHPSTAGSPVLFQ